MISYGYLSFETGFGGGVDFGDVFQNLISPGLHIVLPIGLTAFGLPIIRSNPTGGWRVKVAYYMGIAGLIGIIPTILNWLGYSYAIIAIGALSGMIIILGWVVMGFALIKPTKTVTE